MSEPREAYDIALDHIIALKARAAELVKALEFYARQRHPLHQEYEFNTETAKAALDRWREVNKP